MSIEQIKAKGDRAIAIGPFGSRMKADLYVPDGVPVIRGNNLSDTRSLIGDLVQVSETTADELAGCNVFAGDLVFPHRGSIGQVGIVPEDSNRRYMLSTSLMKLSCNENLVDPLFVFYFFRSDAGRHALLQNASTVGTPGIGQPLASLRSIVLPVPPLDQQRAIAHILGTLDEKIELNRRMNETLEATARALFTSWFVNFDPVRAKAEGRDPGLPSHLADLFPDSFEDSELGEIPTGWRASTLGHEVARCGGRIQTGPFGSQLHASDYVQEGVPVVMPKDLAHRRVSSNSIALIREEDANRLARHRMQEGDIVYSRRGDVERHGLIRSREVGWLCGTGCLLVRLGTDWPSPLFASFALDLPDTRAWIVQHAIGATMPNLNTGILERVPVIVPPDASLHAFNVLAQPLADRVIAGDLESDALAATRDTLLPKLISGELRLTDLSRFADAAL